MRRKFLMGLALVATLPLGTAQAADEVYESSLAFVPMERISIPIVDAGNVEGALRFTVVLEASDDEAIDEVSKLLPVYRAEALSVGAEFSKMSAAPFLAVEAEDLARDLNASLTAKSEKIERVLLVEVTARSS